MMYQTLNDTFRDVLETMKSNPTVVAAVQLDNEEQIMKNRTSPVTLVSSLTNGKKTVLRKASFLSVVSVR